MNEDRISKQLIFSANTRSMMDIIRIEIDPKQNDPFGQMHFTVKIWITGECKTSAGRLNVDRFFESLRLKQSEIVFVGLAGEDSSNLETNLRTRSYLTHWSVGCYELRWDDVLNAVDKIIAEAKKPAIWRVNDKRFEQRLKMYSDVRIFLNEKVCECHKYEESLADPIDDTKMSAMVDQWILFYTWYSQKISEKIRTISAESGQSQVKVEGAKDLSSGSNILDQMPEELWDYDWDRIYEDPELLWRFIVCAYQRNLPNELLWTLEAEQLETLLSWAGPEYIDKIEELARRDERFRMLSKESLEDWHYRKNLEKNEESAAGSG